MKGRADGFSLLEALIGVSLLGIVTSAVLPALTGTLTSNAIDRQRRDAVSVARATLQDLDAKGVPTLPMKGTDRQRTERNGRTYTVDVTYCQTQTYCVLDTSRHVRLEVSHHGKTLYSAETVLAKVR